VLCCLLSNSFASSFQVREARVLCFKFILPIFGSVLHSWCLCGVHDEMSMHWLLFWMNIWRCRHGTVRENY